MKKTTKKPLRSKVKATPRRVSRSKPRSVKPRKAWRRQVSTFETWQNYRVNVTRAPNGRFVTWRKVVYGRQPSRPLEAQPSRRPSRTYRRRETPVRRYARERLAQMPRLAQGNALSVYGKAWTPDGVRSRRWELVKGSVSGQEWRNAVGIARRRPPKERYNHRPMYAEDLDPDEFEGEWVDTPEIESK